MSVNGLESGTVEESDSRSAFIFHLHHGESGEPLGEFLQASTNIPGISCESRGINVLRISTANNLLSIRLDWASLFYIAVQRALNLPQRPGDGHNNGFSLEGILHSLSSFPQIVVLAVID